MHKLILSLLLIAATCSVMAGEAAPVPGSGPADPALEARVQAISEELRCMVCQNQTIADSHADLAIDLKNQVREMLKQGMSDKQVIDFMVQRYGDFVLYRPPVKSTTWLLWFGPFLLFAVGLGVLFVKLRGRRDRNEQTLSAEDHEAAVKLLNSGKDLS